MGFRSSSDRDDTLQELCPNENERGVFTKMSRSSILLFDVGFFVFVDEFLRSASLGIERTFPLVIYAHGAS